MSNHKYTLEGTISFGCVSLVFAILKASLGQSPIEFKFHLSIYIYIFSGDMPCEYRAFCIS